jgi:hypothetical protein
LNCGIDDSGWRPPHIRVQDLVFKDLDSALASPGTPFQACQQFVTLFNRYGGEFNCQWSFVFASQCVGLTMFSSSSTTHPFGVFCDAGEQLQA